MCLPLVIHNTYVRISFEKFTFADDLLLISDGDQSRCQEMVSHLVQQCQNYVMRISRDNTEVLVTSREPNHCDMELGGGKLEIANFC